jgi:hypothetical protein
MMTKPSHHPRSFKGTVSGDRYFFEGLFSTFCVSADDFQGPLKAFHYPKQLLLLTFYLLL